MEKISNAEGMRPQITGQQVMESFRSFQSKAQNGFKTEESRLGEYGRFVATAAEYYNQPNLLVSRRAEVLSLTSRLFYDHDKSAPISLDFFKEAASRVQTEVLGNWAPIHNAKNDQEIEMFGLLLNQELTETAQRHQAEQVDRRIIDKLASEAGPLPDIAPVKRDLDTLRQQKQQFENQLVEQLATQPELKGDVAEAILAKKELDTLTQSGEVSSDSVKRFFDSQGNLIEDSVETQQDLILHLQVGDTEYVAKFFQDLSAQKNLNQILFEKWFKEGVIPAELYNSYSEIMTLVEFGETANALKDTSKETKAKQLLPFIERNISASLIREVAEGRIEFSEDILAQQIDIYLDLFEAQQTSQELPNQSDQKMSSKQKVIVAIMGAAIVAAPFIYHYYAEQKQDQSFEQMLAEVKSVEAEEEELEAAETENLVGSVEVGGSSLAGVESVGSSGNSDFFNDGVIKPENSESISQEVDWDIEGSNLTGYYRDATSSKFQALDKGWLIQRRSFPALAQASQKDIRLTKTTIIAGKGIMGIPSRVDYAPTVGSLTVAGLDRTPDIRQSPDGTFYLVFNPADVGKKVTIEYSLGKTSSSILPKPSPEELKNMAESFITVEDLPDGDVKNFMRKVEASGESKEVKAKLIEKYIRSNFIYSLDKKWSDEYHRQQNVKGFFRKIVELKRCDCDVANSAVAILLRSQQIPTRMVYGQANTGVLNSDEKKLTKGEYHGWVEAYISGKWVTLDGTPVNKELGSEPEINSEQEREKQRRLRAQQGLIDDAVSWTHWLGQNGWFGGLLEVSVINFLAFKLAKKIEKSNTAKSVRLYQELSQRVNHYTNDDGNSSIGNYLKKGEERKIGKYYDHDPDSKFGLIPLFGLNDLGKAINRWLKLKEMPYSDQKSDIEPAAGDPNRLEFLTKVLGYEEGELKRKSLTRNYDNFSHEVSREMIGTINNKQFLGLLTPKFGYEVKDTIYALTSPSSPEEWASTQAVTTAKLYDRYIKERAKAARKFTPYKDNQGNTIDVNSFSNLSLAEFEEQLDPLFNLQILAFTVEDEYQKAMRSLPKKKGLFR